MIWCIETRGNTEGVTMHTLIGVMLFFSMDPLFDLAIYAMQVCFTLILPELHISLLEVGRKAKHQCLGEDTNTLE
jgi:hypothetical protein